MAAGATFLETVANPYITKLGDEKSAAQRLNLAQSFNGVGAFIAPIIGGQIILSGIEHTKEELNKYDPGKIKRVPEFRSVNGKNTLPGYSCCRIHIAGMFSFFPIFRK